eukprot:2643350-Rhodomonas_salina.1
MPVGAPPTLHPLHEDANPPILTSSLQPQTVHPRPRATPHSARQHRDVDSEQRCCLPGDVAASRGILKHRLVPHAVPRQAPWLRIHDDLATPHSIHLDLGLAQQPHRGPGSPCSIGRHLAFHCLLLNPRAQPPANPHVLPNQLRRPGCKPRSWKEVERCGSTCCPHARPDLDASALVLKQSPRRRSSNGDRHAPRQARPLPLLDDDEGSVVGESGGCDDVGGGAEAVEDGDGEG